MLERPSILTALLATLPVEAVAYIVALETVAAAVPGLQAETATLRERVTALEARVGQDSTNSSRPPSSDPPGRRSRPQAPSGQRSPGGQRGRRGAFRQRHPPAAVTQVQVCAPAACGACGQMWPEAADPADRMVQRHQVTELPCPSPSVTEYQVVSRRCGACGSITRGHLPADAPRGAFGPVLLATLSVLTGRYRLSKREAADLLATLYGVDLAVGTVSAAEAQVSQALAPLMAEAEAAARAAAVANVDETGWVQGRKRTYLWTMVTAAATVFHAGRRRTGAALTELLGPAWNGVVGSDRYGAYKQVPVERRQVCWAHARRDFQALADGGETSRPVGERLVALTGEVFAWWHQYRAGEVDRPALDAGLGRVAAELAAVLAVGRDRGQPGAVQRCCREYTAVWPALWTFVRVPGVEPTNNAAERALRPAVLWRKGSYGTHSETGSRFVERMLTVGATARQHGRALLPLVVEALTALRGGSAPPRLLPVTAP